MSIPTRSQHYGAFADASLDEAWLIVPMSLRIVGYGPPSVCKYPDRPTLLVEGEIGGAAWVGAIIAGEDDIRRVHGAVSMLPDGNVRWQLVRAQR